MEAAARESAAGGDCGHIEGCWDVTQLSIMLEDTTVELRIMVCESTSLEYMPPLLISTS